jgi:hypothetical protein
MEQIIKKERKKRDKVFLSLENNEKLSLLLAPFEKWNDVVSITKSDLVNFIISHCNETLSANEVKTLLKAMVNRNENDKQRRPRQKKVASKNNGANGNIT